MSGAAHDLLPDELLAELTAAGLDPRAVHDAIVAAIAEDLPPGSPGVDVTSAATIPADLHGDADRQGGPKSWETTNLVHLGRALTHAAALREETRGGHVREDFPARDDEHFAGHVDVVLVDGAPSVRFHPSPATDGGAA